ncbi:1793_t:CDS:2 [Diversispora eburnea]|uniref:1793_t:CDS:1 n=1 Tax=Diversispora eburnea TaxID=1213867 RepID=A0A9N8YWE8_9GLOM|nr:1793_t:CDS:2 [Diversispora eburnea]
MANAMHCVRVPDTKGNHEISQTTLNVVSAIGEPFVPLIGAVTIVISEIIKVYETVQYNKKICNSLMDRVNNAEAAVKTFERRQTENKDLSKQEYYNSFVRFVEIMNRIKKFIGDVSNLNKYQKFIRSGSVKSGFDSLVKDFDEVMTGLHFTMAVANEEQRRIDQIALESDNAEMTEFLKRIEGGIIDQDQKINIVINELSIMKEKLDHSDSFDNNIKNIKADEIKSTDLVDPNVPRETDRRGKNRQVIKKMYKSIEVACKPINLQNSDPKEAAKIQGLLAILGKLHESLNVIRFYGLSYTENSNVMVFEWALSENIQIALDICRGLTFLHSCDILHDIRCAHILMTTELVPKIAKFNYSRMAYGPTTDMKGVTDIIRWMAPEKLRDSEKKHVPYTFKCEIFSFGMLLWELVFEKIPYEKWNIMQIKKHVLDGNREKITWGKASSNVEKIQKDLTKIIVSAWQHNPAIRASLQGIFMKLDKLNGKHCTGKETVAKLLPDKELDLDGSLSHAALSHTVSISDDFYLPDMDMDDFNVDEILQIIPLEEGIAAHRNKEYAKAWKCFSAHADLKNSTAKYWKGYYLWEGIEVKEDHKKASELFKEAADDEIPDAQLRYAISLVNNPLVKFDSEIFLKYITKAADNNNPTAQYNLGDVYFHGKLNQDKNEKLGIKYLKLAALNDQPKAKKLLQELGINGY